MRWKKNATENISEAASTDDGTFESDDIFWSTSSYIVIRRNLGF